MDPAPSDDEAGEPPPRYDAVTEKWSRGDLVAITVLSRTVDVLAPWTSWSMRPSAVLSIVNEIRLRRRQCVVELGSGASTIYFARALAEAPGGRLVSIEQDPEWAELVARDLARLQLTGPACVHTLELAPFAGGEPEPPGSSWRMPDAWYPRAELLERLPGGIDCLIVDGPPGGHADVLARAPALPSIRPRMAPDYSLFLDDIDRPAEAETFRRWQALDDLVTEISPRTSLGAARTSPGFFPFF